VLLGGLALALAVPIGLIVVVASRIDLDLDLDVGPQGCGKDPPTGTDLAGLDAATGRERWHRDLDNESTFLGFDGGTVAIVEDDGTFLAVDGRTGRQLWSYELRDKGDAVVGGGLVVAAVEKNDVVAFDLRSGRRLWQVSPGPFLPTSPVAIADGAAIVKQGGWTMALDAASGAERWRLELPALTAARAQGDLLFVREGHEAFKAVDTTSGATLWGFELPSLESDAAAFVEVVDYTPIAAGPVVGVTVFDTPTTTTFPPTTSTVFLDALTGQERWRTASGALSSFSFDAATGTLYEYGEERNLVARDPGTGTPRWRVPTGFGRLLATDTRVFAADEDVYAFDAASGRSSWTALTGSDACPAGVDNDVVTVLSTNQR
jgi:outer membrane protein assembly factor BamB